MEVAEKNLKFESMFQIDFNNSNKKELLPFSMEEYISILKQTEDDIENNRVVSFEDLKLEIEKW